MITVTERAATRLQEVLETKHAPPGHGVKLLPTATGSIRMTIATPSDGDEVVHHGETPLLIIDSRIAPTLQGTELDCRRSIVDGRSRNEFTIRAVRQGESAQGAPEDSTAGA
ncbi:MAG TPA: hypothetical protein VHS99_00825 [Chloroflexota bacterium]|nr:hypothetical protein [Chloroflexota bacterium]